MLEKIKWDDKYLLNVPKIDMQHKELVSIINEFYDIAEAGGEAYCTKIPAILKKLVDYTIYHFSREEALLTEYGYPTIDFHKMQHENFIKEITKQKEQLANCKQDDGIKFYSFLLSWLLNHIAKADKAWSILLMPKMAKKV